MAGAVAQLGEHLLCKQGVSGSIPLSSTKIGGDGCDRGSRFLPCGLPWCFLVAIATACSFWNWGRSSAGRAPQSHCGGRRFDPARLHHDPCLERKYKVCTGRLAECLFCLHCEEKIDPDRLKSRCLEGSMIVRERCSRLVVVLVDVA